jgi:hypothetical protein
MVQSLTVHAWGAVSLNIGSWLRELIEMPAKIEIHKRLGLSIERVDEIFDEIFDVFKKNRSLRETVELTSIMIVNLLRRV